MKHVFCCCLGWDQVLPSCVDVILGFDLDCEKKMKSLILLVVVVLIIFCYRRPLSSLCKKDDEHKDEDRQNRKDLEKERPVGL